jgi:carbonic anhydrase
LAGARPVINEAKMNKDGISPDHALRLLMEGNDRFAVARAEGPNRGRERRILTSAEGQNPFAAVVACSDSRVPVSIVFDRGIGDIFAVRVAGNILGEMGTASIEYAIEHLGIRLIAVLGHSSCGAVQAAMAEASHSVSIRKFVEKITPAVQKTIACNGRLAPSEQVDEIARANVWYQVENLFNNNEIVRTGVEAERLLLMGAFYDLTIGKVEWMGQYRGKVKL